MKYRIQPAIDQAHTLEITYIFEAVSTSTQVQIPFWRPGRYEAGNFGRNYVGMKASSAGLALPVKKISPLVFEVESPLGAQITMSYSCIAADLTAGNTYVDDLYMVVNPVNCLVYALGMEDHSIELSLELPMGWRIATGLKQVTAAIDRANLFRFKAKDIQELFDSPIMAAQHVETLKYEVNGIPFFVHLAGEDCPDTNKLHTDFLEFTTSQVRSFASFPVDDYHFLILLLPFKAYHGVEHENSTMIIFGPTLDLAERQAYKELLGVSSHELYHTWNVKALRPADWSPYDFTQANYSRLGYVAEGVTTYMGDWMLWNSGFFSDAEFLAELNVHVQRHMDNCGRLNQSLADSSLDTWIDGYGKSAPGRRVSIYGEGALLAWICDAILLRESSGDFGLNDVMRRLFKKFPKGQGYTESAYWEEMSRDNKFDWDSLRTRAVDGREGLLVLLGEAIASLGLQIIVEDSPVSWERSYGMILQNGVTNSVVSQVFRGSPAAYAGVWPGDVVVRIDNQGLQGLLDENTNLEGKSITLLRTNRLKNAVLHSDGKSWRKIYRIAENSEAAFLFDLWRSRSKLVSSNT